MPTKADFETIFLERDEMLAILPENHTLVNCDKIPIEALAREPFMLLEKGGKSEITELFEENGLNLNTRFTTWDDYAVMSMVESGLGVSILPRLILKRIPYNIVAKELDVPIYRDICLAMRSRKNASVAVKRFLNYLPNR